MNERITVYLVFLLFMNTGSMAVWDTANDAATNTSVESWSTWMWMHTFLSGSVLVSYCHITKYPQTLPLKTESTDFLSFSGSGVWGRLSWMIPAQGPSGGCHKDLEWSVDAVAPPAGLPAEDPLSSSVTWLFRGLRVFLALGWRLEPLTTWASVLAVGVPCWQGRWLP